MTARRLALALLPLIVAAPLQAQTLLPPPASPTTPPAAVLAPPPPAPPPSGGEVFQQGRIFCDQNVTYRLADPESVPEPFRPFLGVWSDAAWDARTCAALVVENVQRDGTASIIYVYGPLSSGARVPGAVLHGTGVVRDGQLLFQNSDGSQYAFRPAIVDLAGRFTTPRGQTYEAVFKKTPS